MMEIDETATLIAWLGQYDGRIQVTKATRDVWHHSVGTFTFEECKQAILEHARFNEGIVATPAAIKVRASQIRSRRVAQDRAEAIEAPLRREKKHADYQRRVRNEPWFRELFEQGRREGNAMRAAATAAREDVRDQEWDAA